MKINTPKITSSIFLSLRKSIVFFILSSFLVFGWNTSMNAQIYTYEQKITISVSDESLEEVLTQITAATDVHFVFDKRKLPLGTKVNLSVKDQPLRKVLEDLLDNLEIEHSYFEGQVSLYVKDAAKFTISGFIRDQASGEELSGANIYESKNLKGTNSNEVGFFSLTLPKGKHEIVWSFIGYEERRDTINLYTNILKFIALSKGAALKEIIVIPSTSTTTIAEDSDLAKEFSDPIEVDKLDRTPALLGANDILKSFALLPGVQTGNEGANGISVRGGGPDQNLILLDGAPIFNPYHLLGFVSIFDNNAIGGAQVYKNGFPARYGGRLSSVMDIRLKKGNTKSYHGSLNIGLISAGLFLEGPIKKNKSSFLITARRSWIDLFVRAITEIVNSQSSNSYGFYDFNVKLYQKLGERHSLSANFFSGRDRFFFENQSSAFVNSLSDYESNSNKWGNIAGTFSWQGILTPKLIAKTNLSLSLFRNETSNRFTSNQKTVPIEQQLQRTFSSLSNIRDISMNVEFNYFPNNQNNLRCGFGISSNFINPINSSNSSSQNGVISINYSTTSGISSQQFFFYLEDQISLSDKLTISPSIRLVGYLNTGGPNLGSKYYAIPEPRFLLNYAINSRHKIDVTYSRMSQYFHLLLNPGIGFPADLWIPSTNIIRPELSDQVSFGYGLKMKHGFRMGLTGFYKAANRLVAYKEGANFYNSALIWQDAITTGKGKSYGGEFLLERKTGKTTGSLSYTLSKTTRTFSRLNYGNTFPYRFDKTHNIKLIFNQQIVPRVDCGLVWNYSSGNPVSLSRESYQTGTQDFISYPWLYPINNIEKNNYRLPATHRLDVAFNFHKKKKRVRRVWTAGIYNFYGRANVYTMYPTRENGEIEFNKLSLVPFPVPYFMYRIKF